jgi:hypothetical protein
MEKKTVIRRFNPLNSQNHQYKTMHSKIQHILYYAESRFWSILNNLALADDSKRLWCQTLLHRELVIKYRIEFKLFYKVIIHSCSFYLMLESEYPPANR